jgi:hypothetical protein
MVLKKVLKEAGGDSHPKVLIGVGTPFAREAPHFIRVLLDMLGNVYDRLPSRVQLVLGSFLPGEYPLSFPYGVGDSHVFNKMGFILDVVQYVMGREWSLARGSSMRI